MKKRWMAAGMATLALVAASCGGANADSSPTVPPSPTSAAMGEMIMGDASLLRADRIVDAEVATGPFELLDTAPVGYDNATGTAWVARHDGGTTVTVDLDGLIPNSLHIAHVHAGPCTAAGGPHFQFEADGGELPPNEIHLMFTSDADGNGSMTAESSQIAGGDARSLVVHPVNHMDAKVACADLG